VFRKAIIITLIFFNAGPSKAQHLYLGGQFDFASVSILPMVDSFKK